MDYSKCLCQRAQVALISKESINFLSIDRNGVVCLCGYLMLNQANIKCIQDNIFKWKVRAISSIHVRLLLLLLWFLMVFFCCCFFLFCSTQSNCTVVSVIWNNNPCTTFHTTKALQWCLLFGINEMSTAYLNPYELFHTLNFPCWHEYSRTEKNSLFLCVCMTNRK